MKQGFLGLFWREKFNIRALFVNAVAREPVVEIKF